MDNAFYSFYEFMFHTENITYILIAAALIFFPLFWRFLNERDGDDQHRLGG